MRYKRGTSMTINSRTKGKVGELEFSKLCRRNGYNTRRTQQFCGSSGQAADVVGLDGISIEVKRVEHLNIHEAMNQSVRDSTAAGKGSLPIVAHRKNRTDWLITMRASDWFKLYSAWKPPSGT